MPLKPTVVINPPPVAVMVELALPCSVNVWVVAPTIRLADGVMVLSSVVLVMSALKPLPAANNPLRARAGVVPPVPPLATDKIPENLILPSAPRDIGSSAPTAIVPLASGMLMVRVAVIGAKLIVEVTPLLLEAFMVELLSPCMAIVLFTAPTVNDEDGVMLLTDNVPEIVVSPLPATTNLSELEF